ncbi:hypothetical protein LIER_40408 [Lithospermum erythrorhizon]|uniref:Reverse transcriptase Ty1/copia-type domain-containing protein n=1 Tax=Lithospermum erythrorhizon TaxID=34254 RepID=A0AAV3QTZ2_LITER
MLVYVDDIRVTGNSVRVVDDFIRALNARLVTRDLGDLSFFLGIEAISQASGGLLLSQRQYMLDLLVKANMEHCKPASTPMSTSSGEDCCDYRPNLITKPKQTMITTEVNC